MNLDDLMEVWRSQDAAPLHGINETLLRLALRQAEAEHQSQRRWENGISSLVSAFLVGAMAVCLVVMIYCPEAEMRGWDFAVPVVGAAAVLFWPGFLRVSHRAQVQRGQSYGESLRDQLNRHIARLDYLATRVASLAHHLFTNLPAMIWSMAFFFAIVRINEKPFRDSWADPKVWVVFVGTHFALALLVGTSIRMQRRWVQRDLLPRKRRLEALRKELDDQE